MILKYLAFILIIAQLVGCASKPRSGRYILANGKWEFKEEKIGFMYQLANPRIDNEPFDYEQTGRFAWPLPSSKKISSYFGARRGKNHDGIDIAAPKGSHIVASDNGKVIFAGNMRGYGRVIVISHEKNYQTIYAHNSKNFVAKNQKVSQGEVIAQVGNSGRASGPHLHFEIRKHNKVSDPALYIPWIDRRRLAQDK